jgi:hypothetical protein
MYDAPPAPAIAKPFYLLPIAERSVPLAISLFVLGGVAFAGAMRVMVAPASGETSLGALAQATLGSFAVAASGVALWFVSFGSRTGNAHRAWINALLYAGMACVAIWFFLSGLSQPPNRTAWVSAPVALSWVDRTLEDEIVYKLTLTNHMGGEYRCHRYRAGWCELHDVLEAAWARSPRTARMIVDGEELVALQFDGTEVISGEKQRQVRRGARLTSSLPAAATAMGSLAEALGWTVYGWRASRLRPRFRGGIVQ